MSAGCRCGHPAMAHTFDGCGSCKCLGYMPLQRWLAHLFGGAA